MRGKKRNVPAGYLGEGTPCLAQEIRDFHRAQQKEKIEIEFIESNLSELLQLVPFRNWDEPVMSSLSCFVLFLGSSTHLPVEKSTRGVYLGVLQVASEGACP